VPQLMQPSRSMTTFVIPSSVSKIFGRLAHHLGLNVSLTTSVRMGPAWSITLAS
jgi:hypothetical protein